MPYQVFGERAGAVAVMIAWSPSARAAAGAGISAILASTAPPPSALPTRGPRRASAFSSLVRSFIAPRSSSVSPSNVLPVAAVLSADFCVLFIGGSPPASLDGDDLMLGSRRGGGFSGTARRKLGRARESHPDHRRHQQW